MGCPGDGKPGQAENLYVLLRSKREQAAVMWSIKADTPICNNCFFVYDIYVLNLVLSKTRNLISRFIKMIDSFANVRIQTILISALSLLFWQTLLAEEKPYAPETIQDVVIVSAEQTIDMILASPELLVIDSRKKTEYLKGHIEGSINILNTQLEREELERIAPDKTKAILFYCNGVRCLRSTDSITKARSWGYSNLIWFRGGWKEWTEKRLPVIVDK